MGGSRLRPGVEGHAGSLDVQVGRLMLTGGAQLDSSPTGLGGRSPPRGTGAGRGMAER